MGSTASPTISSPTSKVCSSLLSFPSSDSGNHESKGSSAGNSGADAASCELPVNDNIPVTEQHSNQNSYGNQSEDSTNDNHLSSRGTDDAQDVHNKIIPVKAGSDCLKLGAFDSKCEISTKEPTIPDNACSDCNEIVTCSVPVSSLESKFSTVNHESHFERCRRIFDSGEGKQKNFVATKTSNEIKNSNISVTQPLKKIYGDNKKCQNKPINIVSIELEPSKAVITSRLLVTPTKAPYKSLHDCEKRELEYHNGNSMKKVFSGEFVDSNNFKRVVQTSNFSSQMPAEVSQSVKPKRSGITTVCIKAECHEDQQTSFKNLPPMETNLSSPSKVRQCLKLSSVQNVSSSPSSIAVANDHTSISQDDSCLTNGRALEATLQGLEPLLHPSESKVVSENTGDLKKGESFRDEDSGVTLLDISELDTSQNSSSGYSTLDDSKVFHASNEEQEDSDSFCGEVFKTRKNPKFENYRSPRGRRSKRGILAVRPGSASLAGSSEGSVNIEQISVAKSRLRRSSQVYKSSGLREAVSSVQFQLSQEAHSNSHNISNNEIGDHGRRFSDTNSVRSCNIASKPALPCVLEEPPHQQNYTEETYRSELGNKHAKSLHFQPSGSCDGNAEAPLVKISAFGHLHEESPGCCVLSGCSRAHPFEEGSVCCRADLQRTFSSEGEEQSGTLTKLGVLSGSCRCVQSVSRSFTPPPVLSYPTGTFPF